MRGNLSKKIRLKMLVLSTIGLFLYRQAGGASFSFEDTGNSLVVKDGTNSVLAYNYKPVPPPKDVEGLTPRSCYVHPLYDLDGGIVTQDWPPDHYHHRGVFWAWPYCQVNGRRMDLWLSKDAHQQFEKCLQQIVTEQYALLEVENSWRFDDSQSETPVTERVRITVYPAEEHGRCIDFMLTFINNTETALILQGQQDSAKGYGGFCVRPNMDRGPVQFAAAEGPVLSDAFQVASAWLDVSFASSEASKSSGVAIFQHPQNPDYPHDGWLVRHYGFLGASWPHTKSYELLPHQSLVLRYRVYVHRGDATVGKVADQFRKFIAEAK